MMIDIAKSYSPYPSGRFPTDGAHNGQRFRDTVLVPAMQEALRQGGEPVVVNIDGVRTFGSSFLEEAFGGLVRKGIFTRDQVRRGLEIVCTKPHLFLFRDAIAKYIASAQPEERPSLHA